MKWYEAIAWTSAGFAAVMFLDIYSDFRFGDRPRNYPTGKRVKHTLSAYAHFVIVRYTFTLAAWFALFGSSSGASPNTAVVTGFAFPLFLDRLTRISARAGARSTAEREREVRIREEAARLSTIRSSHPDVSSPLGVSADVADILDAMRKDLVGQLPVVDSGDERSG
jgi:hypothetical protein